MMFSKSEWFNSKGEVWKKAYWAFDNMKARCRSSNHSMYPRYGGRGIELRIKRHDFIDWYVRTAKGRTDLTVDRIDNDGHYEFDNIQLITSVENTLKACRESNARKQSQIRNAKQAWKKTSRRVKIGSLEFPSISAASFHFGSQSYIFMRIRDYGGMMPDGTKIVVDQ